ncbi:MAG: hypothetical protein ACT4P4_11735 [Betaproteobacteria bacterium]
MSTLRALACIAASRWRITEGACPLAFGAAHHLDRYRGGAGLVVGLRDGLASCRREDGTRRVRSQRGTEPRVNAQARVQDSVHGARGAALSAQKIKTLGIDARFCIGK